LKTVENIPKTAIKACVIAVRLRGNAITGVQLQKAQIGCLQFDMQVIARQLLAN